MSDAHKNFPYSTVATAPSPATTGTSLVLAAGGGALIPAVPFNAVIWPVSVQPLASNAEIVRVTAIVTDTITITRNREGTSARTVVVGDQFAASITAKTLADVEGNRRPTQDTIINSGFGQVLAEELEIADGYEYEIADDAILEIT